MKKLKKIDKIVYAVLSTILIFTTICITANLFDKQIQPEIITGFYALLGTELVTCGGIVALDRRKKGE